ncbi:hypothetical protein [Streptomyces sp. NPDC086782]|uniref:hypothetical protein n=1 Tax=Streptomyces sp. NPDC086782 TaxID=3365757 RepID=UPI0037F86938
MELAEAALPYTSGQRQGIPAALTHELAAWRTAVASGDQEALKGILPSLLQAAAAVSRMPDTAEGHRLAAALRAYSTPLSADAAASAGQAAAAGAAMHAPADRGQVEDGGAGDEEDGHDDLAPQDEEDGQDDLAPEDEEGGQGDLVPGDERDEPEGHVFPALRILKDAVDRSKMHPVPVIRTEERDSGPWPLISEDMDGEPRWVHPDVTLTRVPHIKANGKRVRRDQLDVPDTLGEGVMCLIDRNGSYPSACSAVPLAPNKLLHTGPLEAFDKTKAGIYLIDVPEWTRTDMPHPLGRIIERPDGRGRVWVTTPHIKQLEKLVREGHLDAAPVVHDSWTGKANESLFKPFYEATRKARTELVQVGGDPYKAYKTRLSIALRLLWPKRQEQKSPFWRPDWRMSMVAEASVRHWSVAFRAVQEGHTLLALRNVDAAVFWTPPGTPPATYRIGTGFGEVKAKFVQRGEIIPEGDD